MSQNNRKTSPTKVNKFAETLENYLKYGVDLHHRRIYFGDVDFIDGDEFSFSTVNIAMRGIDKMLDISNKPIEIHMSSYGGSVDDLIALYNKIEESPCKFIFFGRGYIMSAATFVMAVCDERYLSKNTAVMIHDMSADIAGSMPDLEIEADELRRIKEDMYQMYADNSVMDVKFWEIACKRNLYLNAEETIRLGLADKIIPTVKRGNFRRGPRARTFAKRINKRSMERFISKLFDRIGQSAPENITIEVPSDEFEEIEEYDNTDEVMKEMGLNKSGDKDE